MRCRLITITQPFGTRGEDNPWRQPHTWTPKNQTNLRGNEFQSIDLPPLFLANEGIQVGIDLGESLLARPRAGHSESREVLIFWRERRDAQTKRHKEEIRGLFHEATDDLRNRFQPLVFRSWSTFLHRPRSRVTESRTVKFEDFGRASEVWICDVFVTVACKWHETAKKHRQCLARGARAQR